MKLFPAIVTLHLLGGLLLLVLLCVQAMRYAQMHSHDEARSAPPKLRRLLWLSLILLVGQITLGGWVSTNYAVLACTDFPQCQNSWWPEMNFRQGFEIWRQLGFTAAGEHIDFAALTAIHYVHRLASYFVLALLALLAWRMHRLAAWRRAARWLAGLLVLQFLTGLSNVVLDWPLLAAVLHTGGAAVMVLVLTWALAADSNQSVERFAA
jgi:cytochrome c oxidase assembly protein subunit 15